MAGEVDFGIKGMEAFDYRGKTVLLRLDINSTLHPETKRIVSENRINMSIPTIQYILDQNAKLVIIAHQGDTLDYENLIPMTEHAKKLSDKLGITVQYVDDVAGPAAQDAIKNLEPGEAVLLGNLRYLTEEISTFENSVKLEPDQMLGTYLVRNIAPLVDYYVNDAFSAAHRNAPSMVAFQELLPTAGGLLMMKELSALTKVMTCPEKPSIFVLGGAKISDAFGMMKQVLENGSADKILACGVTGNIMLMASGYSISKPTEKFIKDRSLDVFIEPAKTYLTKYPGKIIFPVDLAYEENGQRREVDMKDLPVEAPLFDIGSKTIAVFAEEIRKAGTIFVNGPAGVYEKEVFEKGTKEIWKAIAEAKGYSVIGGGDTVSAAQKFIDIKNIGYVCTAGGAMVQFLSGEEMPLIKAMKKASRK
ncbi:MAG TPA: phosphoglycerate kinase [Clostridiales bacterium]|nr:phosphoglycerate kinase [Clostridiales bacterium]